MDFKQVFEQSELVQLLDYFNPEVINFQLQSCLLTTGVVVQVLKDQTFKEALKASLSFTLKMIPPDRGVHRLKKYAPEFSNLVDQLVYFDDDSFKLSKVSTGSSYSFLGRQIFLQTELKPTLEGLVPEGVYLLQITAGNTRQQTLDYLNNLDYQEWHKKNRLKFNVVQLFLKKDFEVAKIILIRRCQLLQINLPDINWEKVKSISASHRGEYIMQFLPDVLVISSKNSLKIKQSNQNFIKNISNDEFIKSNESVRSYLSHLKKW